MPLPPARFPAAIATDADLLVQGNVVPSQAGNFPTVLGALAASATTIPLAAGYGQQLPSDNFEVSIEDEIVRVGLRSGDQLTNCVRGAEGTTASSHAAGVAVLANLTALAHNQVASEVIAIETAFKAQSLDLNMPPEWNDPPNVVGGSGTLSPTWASQAPNKVWATPAAAPNAPPGFRGLTYADLPATLANSRSANLGVTTTPQTYSVGGLSGATIPTIYLLSVSAVALDQGGQSWSMAWGTWLVGANYGYPGTVEVATVTALASWFQDSGPTARLTIVGVAGSVVHITLTINWNGLTPDYPASSLIYSLLRLF